MSRLIKNTRPAERRAGCIFSETFENSAAVAENGGILYADASVSAGRLILKDATVNTSVKFEKPGKVTTTEQVSIVMEFWPDFEANDGSYHCLFDIDQASSRCMVLKSNSGNLLIYVFGAATMSASYADYNSYWYVGSRNVLMLVSESGNTKVYLNGVDITIGGRTGAWTTGPSDFALGIGTYQSSGNFPWNGQVGLFQIYNRLLTAQEALAIYNRTMWNYEDRAVLDLRMDMASHDPTNTRALDSSPSKAHATLGDGATSTTPTKLAERGYEFDGGDYLVGPATGLFNSDEISIVMIFTPDFAVDEDVTRYIFDTTQDSRYVMLKYSNATSNALDLYLGDTKVQRILEGDYSSHWNVGRKNILIITGDSGANLTNIWLNGFHILVDDATAWTLADPASFYIGSRNNGGTNFDGKIHSFKIYPEVLNETQVQDILLKSNLQVNGT